MSINLVAVCDKEVVAKQLEQTCDKLGYDITCEIQQENEIINKLSDEALDKSNAILLVTQKEIEQIEDMDRFKHRHYYQVLPIFIMQDTKAILDEIIEDLK